MAINRDGLFQDIFRGKKVTCITGIDVGIEEERPKLTNGGAIL